MTRDDASPGMTAAGLTLRALMRRAFDMICATLGLAMLAPLFALIAAAIKLEDGGPVFYRHRRVGRDFRTFGLIKFRSMVVNADRLGGPVTAAEDPRVTRVGRFLRKTKLDELPQLVNVISGDVQLVGARPESECYVRMFPDEYAELLRHRPGITDPASLAYREEEAMFAPGDVEAQYVTQFLPRKLALSLHHARRRSFRSDLEIILRTILPWPAMPSRSFEDRYTSQNR